MRKAYGSFEFVRRRQDFPHRAPIFAKRENAAFFGCLVSFWQRKKLAFEPARAEAHQLSRLAQFPGAIASMPTFFPNPVGQERFG